MNRSTGLILALALGSAALPMAADAQEKCEGKNNRWTRSAGLYLERAAKASAEERAELLGKALEQVTEGTGKDADNPKIWFVSGQVHSRLGDMAKADEQWDRVEQLCASGNFVGLEVERLNSWVAAYNEGVQASQAGDMAAAIEKMAMADAVYQGRPEARVNLGIFHANAGNNEKAIEAFRGSLEILGNEALLADLSEEQKASWAELEEIASFNMAQLLAMGGKNEEAVEAYRAYLAKHPDNLAALQNLAIVLNQLGRGSEATELYATMLNRTDLGALELFNVGVGFFNAELYDNAAEAFRKALAKNPHMRDARYNLLQGLYAPTLPLDSIHAKATGEEKKKVAGQLTTLYTEIVEQGSELLKSDPLNANAMLIVARANKSLADLAATKAEGDRFRNATMAVLEKQQAIPVAINEITTQGTETGLKVTGALGNLNAKEGAPITLRFTFLAEDGTTISTQDVTVNAPATGETAEFEVAAEGLEIAGWSYVLVK